METKDYSKSRRKTGLRTFRLEGDLIIALESAAEAESTTVNALVSSLIRRSVEWDFKARKFGYISIDRFLLQALLDRVGDGDLDQFGRSVLAPRWRDMATFFFNDPAPEKILEFLLLRSKHLPRMQVDVTRNANAYRISVHHELGEKWSRVVRGALDELIRNSFDPSAKITGTGAVMTIEFSLPQRGSPT